MSSVKDVTESTFDAEVIQSPTPVLVDFYATWCGPCKALAPVVDEIAREQAQALKVVKLDIDEAQDLVAGLGIDAVPTLVLFKGGKEAYRRKGAAPKRDLLADLARYL